MSDAAEEDLYGTTIIEAKYASRIDRGMALSGFDFPDIKACPDGQPRDENSTQQLQSDDPTSSHSTDEQSWNEAHSSLEHTRARSLLTLPPEIRDRIWRFVLGNLDNAPESVQCRHYYSRSRQYRFARPSLVPRLCFGLQSAVKAGKFPSFLVVSRQLYVEATKLLYEGRLFSFCTWSCYLGWVERVLERDREGGEAMLSLLQGVTVLMDLQLGYGRSETAKEWEKVVQDSVKQMLTKQMNVYSEIVEPTSENQLLFVEVRLTFSLREVSSKVGKSKDGEWNDQCDPTELAYLQITSDREEL